MATGFRLQCPARSTRLTITIATAIYRQVIRNHQHTTSRERQAAVKFTMNPQQNPQPEQSGSNRQATPSPQAGQVPSLVLPTGGGAIKGISENFAANPVTGTASFSIPVPVAAARGFAPELALSYDSGSGNSPFGLGWDVAVPAISRKTDKQLPRYRDTEDSDVYMFTGSEDLVPVLTNQNGVWESRSAVKSDNGQDYEIKRYRPRTEGAFARIERWRALTPGSIDIHWRVWSQTNQLSVFGADAASRIADPDNPNRIFKWLITYTCDDKGNRIAYEYKREDLAGVNFALAHEQHRQGDTQANLYLKRVLYGNTVPYSQRPLTEVDYLFQTVFDWGEHAAANPQPDDPGAWARRDDPFSTYRAGFEIRTYRRCQRILLFHNFTELGNTPTLVRSLDLTYTDDAAGFSFLTQITQMGYRRDDADGYESASLPPMTFTYQEHAWQSTVQAVESDKLANLPAGVDGQQYRWIDLYGEGLSGVLTEQAQTLIYKRNLGEATFGAAAVVARQPSFSGLAQNALQINALESDGQLSMVTLAGPVKGHFALNADETWEAFQPFTRLPNLDFNDPNLRLIDLTGNGQADILITEERALRWYPAEGKAGYGAATITRQLPADAPQDGPQVIFANDAETIFLADMSGDGLQDIVRIRSGQIVYWPNLGYGYFGAQVTMSQAPRLDSADHFTPERIQLADLDGSGTTDLIYLGQGEFRFWLNHGGNSWSPVHQTLNPFPELNSGTTVSVFDLMGTGTGCIVWSSSLPQHASRPLRYIDLMDSTKPHLMTSYANGMGKRVDLHYTPSTHYYLDDRANGTPWISKLHFPVHCLSSVETVDLITGTRFCSEYSYHHGYYDRAEREFRGFGRVDQLDTESFEHFVASGASNIVEQSLHQPPVLTKTWYHTGAVEQDRQFLDQYRHEYYTDPDFDQPPLPEPELPADLTAVEWREALRACRGLALRSEVYGLDGSDQEPHPYSIAEKTCQIKQIQPQGDNRHAVFQVIDSESISYQLDRNPADPRVNHSLTLATNAYGQVLQAATIGYPRRTTDTSLPPDIQQAQAALSITLAITEYTDDLDADDYPAPYDPLQAIPVFRLRQPCETRSYQLHGLTFTGAWFTRDQLLADIDAAVIGYSDTPDGSRQMRLLQHGKVYFLADDLTGPLNGGDLGALGTPHHTEQLAFTPDLLDDHFGSRVTDSHMQEGGYVHSDGDPNWWVSSATAIYPPDAADRFYMATGSRDPFGNVTTIAYDGYHLLAESTLDPAGNQVTAINDYRLQQPVAIQDPNGNWSAVATDALGMVTRSAMLGKLPPGQAPLTATTSEADTLTHPSLEMTYDLHNWVNNGAPNYVITTVWEEHHAANASRTRTQRKYEYSDGSGNVIMVKAQAEPGLARQRQPDGRISEVDTTPDLRWIGNGRTIFNNKGNPIKQYEPYFSVTPDYEDDPQLVEIGVTAIQFYDAAGRNVGRLLPNHTIEKVVITPWHTATWDANDTVLIDNPALDPHIGAYFTDLDSASYLPGWHTARIGGALGPEQARAAQLAAEHANTPAITHTDALGRTIYAEADNASLGIYTTRTTLDIEGNTLNIIDDRGNTVMAYQYAMLPPPDQNKPKPAVHQSSMDSGDKWTLLNVTGQPIRSWDARGHVFRVVYDALQRPTHSYVTTGGSEQLVSMTVYGDDAQAPADPALNLKGQAWQVYDQSGLIENQAYDFKGNVLASTRTLTADYTGTVDWSATPAPALDSEVFASTAEYDALNRITRELSPHHAGLPASEYRPVYDDSGKLAQVELSVRGGPFDTYVRDIAYDAKGQRQSITYGNDITTTYTYDPLTFRLTRLLTVRTSDGASLQDLHYTYDPVGNITDIRDDAQQTVYFQNQQVEPHSQYRYDALYRLIEATGREHAGQAGSPAPDQGWLPVAHPNDGNAMRRYSQHYTYDGAGNILQMAHSAGSNGWTRHYQYAADSNRLLATTLGNPGLPFNETYDYNGHGSMTRMPHLTALIWDHAEQLRQVDLGGGGSAYYVYDNGGQRVRKVHVHNGATVEERIYLNGWEIYRKHTAGQLRLERETLHVMDDQRRIALIETRTVDTQSPNSPPQTLVRYQLSNHLGSAALELNAVGEIVSYEEYHPYGTTAYHAGTGAVEESPKRYRYTGKERDEETGFSYHGARYFSTSLSRWLNPDPAGLADGLNVYAFSKLRPTVMVDESGMSGSYFEREQAPQLSDHYKTNYSEKAIRAAMNEQAAKQLKKSIDKRLEQIFFEEWNAIAENPLYGITSLEYTKKEWEGIQKGYIDDGPAVYSADNDRYQPQEKPSGPLIEDPVGVVLSFLPWTPMGFAIWILFMPTPAYGGVGSRLMPKPKIRARAGNLGKVKGTGSNRSAMARIGPTGQLEMFTGAGVLGRYHRIIPRKKPMYARFSMSRNEKIHWAIDHGGRLIRGTWYVQVRDIGDKLIWMPAALTNRYDLGHITGVSHKHLVEFAQRHNLSKEQWDFLVNDWNLYEPQTVRFNRGHHGDIDYLDIQRVISVLDSFTN
jgi:RHS repeat-associated protein